MDKNRVLGSLHEAKGATKQAIGRAIGDAALAREGAFERIAGKFQKALGIVNDAFRNAVNKS